MSNATKSLIFIFIGLLVITLLVKLTGNQSASEALRSDIVSIDTSKVDRITIDNPAGKQNLTLIRQEGSWFVRQNESSEQFPADNNAITGAVSQLNSLEIKSVVTRDTAKFTRFKVDSTGTTVTLYSDGEQLAGLIVGAPQIASRREFNNYVRPKDEETVYVVEGFLSSTFNRQLEGWRDKMVWTLERDNISQIDFLFPADSSYSVRRSGQDSWISDGDTLNNGLVNSILNRLTSLRATGFVDTMNVEDFGNELYAVQVMLSNGRSRTVRLAPMGEESTTYRAVADDFPFVFTLGKSAWDDSVLRSREELLK